MVEPSAASASRARWRSARRRGLRSPGDDRVKNELWLQTWRAQQRGHGSSSAVPNVSRGGPSQARIAARSRPPRRSRHRRPLRRLAPHQPPHDPGRPDGSRWANAAASRSKRSRRTPPADRLRYSRSDPPGRRSASRWRSRRERFAQSHRSNSRAPPGSTQLTVTPVVQGRRGEGAAPPTPPTGAAREPLPRREGGTAHLDPQGTPAEGREDAVDCRTSSASWTPICWCAAANRAAPPGAAHHLHVGQPSGQERQSSTRDAPRLCLKTGSIASAISLSVRAPVGRRPAHPPGGPPPGPNGRSPRPYRLATTHPSGFSAVNRSSWTSQLSRPSSRSPASRAGAT